MAVLRVGVVGLNARVERVVLPGLAASGRAQVAALCSRDAAKAAHFAAAYPGCRPFTRYSDFVAHDLDAVFVLTPHELHEEMSLAAIEAGRHVCCEKPLALSLDGARRMREAAKRRGVRTAVNFTYRSTTAHRHFARALADPPLGELLGAELVYEQARGLSDPGPPRDALLDLAPHIADALLWWGDLLGAGEPSSVVAVAREDELVWRILVRLSGGALVELGVSRVAAGRRNTNRATFDGRNGALRLAFEVHDYLVERAAAGPESGWERLPTPPDLNVSYRDFPALHFGRIVDALAGDGGFPDFADGVRVQELLEAARRSKEERREVGLPL